MLLYKIRTKRRCGISKLLKRKAGSPAWIRTTITISNAESVTYKVFNGLKCRIGPEKPTLVHNSYTAGSNPATLALAPGSATSAGCGDRVTRRNYLGSQVLLREMFLVQRGNERGTPLLRAGAECVVVRIWGKVALASNGHELCLLPQQVNYFAQQMSSNAKLPEDSFVLREDLFGDQPGKRPRFYPVAKK